MKKSILLLFIAALSFNFSALAQESVLKFNPIGLLLGTGKVTYEKVLSEGSAVELSLTYQRLDLGDFGKVGGLGGQGKYKIYFQKEAPDGWYVAPAVGYKSTKYDFLGEDASINVFNVAILFGHQWVFGDNGGFSIDINTGVKYNSVTIEGDALWSGDGTGLAGNISFGWAF